VDVILRIWGLVKVVSALGYGDVHMEVCRYSEVGKGKVYSAGWRGSFLEDVFPSHLPSLHNPHYDENSNTSLDSFCIQFTS
jgi:hypothetical protein